MATFVLVHSPLVGPASWRPVAHELGRRGFDARVPRLTPPIDAPSPWWRSAAEEVAAAVEPAHAGGVVLVAHSGAGPHLPAFTGRLRDGGTAVEACLFVDAGLPAPGRSPRQEAPEAFDELARRSAQDGRLPPWPEWWGNEVMAGLVPDPAARSELAAECRPVPLALLEEPFPVVTGWPAAPCAVVSFTYEPEAAAAEARGWVVARLPGGHLHQLVDPAAVADALQVTLAASGVRP